MCRVLGIHNFGDLQKRNEYGECLEGCMNLSQSFRITWYYKWHANSNGVKPFDGAFLFACKCIFIWEILRIHIRQSSGNCQAVVRQSSGSCQAVIRQSSGSRQAVARKSSGSHQAVVRRSLSSRQAVVSQSSGSHQAVVKQPYLFEMCHLFFNLFSPFCS